MKKAITDVFAKITVKNARNANGRILIAAATELFVGNDRFGRQNSLKENETCNSQMSG